MVLSFKIFLICLLLLMLHPGCGYKSAEKKEEPVVISSDDIRRIVVNEENMEESARTRKLDTLLKHVVKDSAQFRNTISLMSTAFSNPNSPYRNEDLHIKLLQAQLQSSWYIDVEKEAAKSKLQLAMQNRAGHAANNFTYITADGQKQKMYDIEADHLLLFFYNPECQACKDMKEALIGSEIINAKLKTGELKVLAIYTDKELSTWRRHLPEMPKQWIHGRDENEYLWLNNIYDLKAIPTMYLLDKDKKVLLKDCLVMEEIVKVVR